MILGTHTSISGGLHKALERGEHLKCDTVQIFTKSSNQWKAREISEKDRNLFQAASKSTGLSPLLAHDSYLINLASPEAEMRKKSVDAFDLEMERAVYLGIPFLVFHPGSHKETGGKEGLKRIGESINGLLSKRKKPDIQLLLETTAGQGSNLGYRFEHLRDIIDHVEKKEFMGVCLDTCHIFAAGYDITTRQGYEKTMEEFDGIVGLHKLKAIHLNDSKKGLGSRVDRHEHIGKGFLGLEPFRFLLNDPRFQNMPMVAETPKGEGTNEDLENLNQLRRLVTTQE